MKYNSRHGNTYAEIARELDITAERVRQIEVKALGRLRFLFGHQLKRQGVALLKAIWEEDTCYPVMAEGCKLISKRIHDEGDNR